MNGKNSKGLEDLRRETYELKFEAFDSKINNTWDFMNQKIETYDSRVKTLEGFLREKLYLLKNYKQGNDASIYTQYIEKLNRKLENLNKENNETKIQLTQL